MPVKFAPKPVAKAPVKVAAKVAVKVAAKAAPKATPKATAKPAAPVKAEKVAKPAKAEKPAKPAKAEKSAPVDASVVAPVVSGDVPARAVRPSARLAQITVPSMAQSVASTAAKASYLQNMPSQVLTPPPFVAVKKDPKLANNWKTKPVSELTDAETGKKYVARADDGIHMTTRGYRFVAGPLLKRIKALAPTAPNTVDEGQ